MLLKQKIKSYFGFAIKSNNVIFGGDSFVASKKKAYLVVCSSDINRTIMKDIKNKCERYKIPLLMSDTLTIEELTHKINCKCIAVCEPNLASAIIKEEIGGFDE